MDADEAHVQARFREAQNRHINAMHQMAEAVERTAAASMPAPPARYEHRRQAGTAGADFQPVPPGPDWDLWAWNERDGKAAYMWRRLVPVAAHQSGGGDAGI